MKIKVNDLVSDNVRTAVITVSMKMPFNWSP